MKPQFELSLSEICSSVVLLRKMLFWYISCVLCYVAYLHQQSTISMMSLIDGLTD